MSILESALLGLLQGLTEFLPVSSSGHLRIAKELFGLSEIPMLFDITLHLATLFAVLIFFRKKIAFLFVVLFHWITRQRSMESTADEDAARTMIVALIITTLITGAIGVCTAKLLDENALPVKFVCIGFFFTALLLITSSIVSKRQQHKIESIMDNDGIELPQRISIWQGALIGIMQGIGTLPGVSRSGSTIAGALFGGLNRKLAGEYSFIASIPAIVGAFILELKDFKQIKETVDWLPLAVACAVAFVVGLIALFILQKIIKSGKLHYFAFYLIPLGILGLLFL